MITFRAATTDLSSWIILLIIFSVIILIHKMSTKCQKTVNYGPTVQNTKLFCSKLCKTEKTEKQEPETVCHLKHYSVIKIVADECSVDQLID